MASDFIDKRVAEIAQLTVAEVVADCGALFIPASLLFEQFEEATQMICLGLMLGLLHASVEGMNTSIERTEGVIITRADRDKLFMAYYEMCFKEALQAKIDNIKDVPARYKTTVN